MCQLKKPLVKVTDNFYINIHDIQAVWLGKHSGITGEVMKFTFRNGDTELLLIGKEITKEQAKKFIDDNLI